MSAQRWEVLLGTGRFDQARAEIGQALSTDPGNPGLLCYLARTLQLTGSHTASEPYIRQALAAAPDDEWALRLLASVLLHTKRIPEAVEVAQRAAQQAPLQSTGWMTLSVALIAAKRPLAALGYAKHACRLDPDDTDSAIVMARCYLALQDRQRAIARIGLILRTDPDHGKARELLGQIDSRNHRWQITRLTADIVSDPAARTALRATAPPDLEAFGSRLGDNPATRIRVAGKRVDDRAFVDEMVRGQDPDATRHLGGRMWQALLTLSGLQLIITVLGQDTTGPARPELILATGVGWLVAVAVAFGPLWFGHHRAWRGLLLREVRRPWPAATVAVLVAAGVASPVVLALGGSANDRGPVIGLVIVAGLVSVVRLVQRQTADFQDMIPSGRVLIAGFRRARRVLTVAVLIAVLAALSAIIDSEQDLAASGGGWWEPTVAGVGGILLLGSVGLVWRSDPAVAKACWLLLRRRMRFTAVLVAAALVMGVTAMFLPEDPAVPLILLSILIGLPTLMLLWLAGSARYVPGLNPNAQLRTRRVRRR